MPKQPRMSDAEEPAVAPRGGARAKAPRRAAKQTTAGKTKPGGKPARKKGGTSAQELGEERSPADRSRGARKPANRSGARKQGGRKASRKSTGVRASGSGAKRSGSESGGGARTKKARGGTKGGARGARGR